MNRTLWAVELTTANGKPHLISFLWMRCFADKMLYEGEPMRALVFCTRAQAREFCKGRSVEGWRFRPVKVRETVKICANTK